MQHSKPFANNPEEFSGVDDPLRTTCACGAVHRLNALPAVGGRYAAHCKQCGELFFVGDLPTASRPQLQRPDPAATRAPEGYNAWILDAFQREEPLAEHSAEPPVMMPSITATTKTADAYAETASKEAQTLPEISDPSAAAASLEATVNSELREAEQERAWTNETLEAASRGLSRTAMRQSGSSTPMVQRRRLTGQTQTATLTTPARPPAHPHAHPLALITRAPTSVWQRPLHPSPESESVPLLGGPESRPLQPPRRSNRINARECLLGAAIGLALGSSAAILLWLFF